MAHALPCFGTRESSDSHAKETDMLWTLIVLLLLFWVLGFAFDVAGGIIHILLVIALVIFVVNLISGRRAIP
jgi:uncharacterized membrane protein YtjA (UPF0391 family)